MTVRPVVAGLLLMAGLAGCGGATAAAPEKATPTTSLPPPPKACSLLTDDELNQATGLVTSVKIDVADRCTWEVPEPADSYHNALTIDVDGFESVEEATRLFQPYVAERVTGIGDEASIETSDQPELAIRVGAIKITLTGMNPAVTPDVIRGLGRTAAARAAA